MNNSITLSGCTPTPLSDYLKALGIFRLIATHLDTRATACWENEVFVLDSSLSEEAIQSYFRDDYRPTPIIAPWNGGSGFFAGDNQTGIAALRKSKAQRFANYRNAVDAASKILTDMGINKKPEGDQKHALLSALRNELPDIVLDWLDAAVVLTEDNPKYPPLLGTGGNDGRLDFTNNFMQRITELIDSETGQAQPQATGQLRQALFGEAEPGLKKAAIGQFSPGNAGGANQQSGFSSDALINPWDFILMIEGALLFAASTNRRFGSSEPGTLSYPFTVYPTGAGAGNAALGDEESARAEIWMPLWANGCTLGELQGILSEGRVTLGRKPARDGLDFVRAVFSLGVDRGIREFQRYAFMMRSGKAYLATPLNRVPVKQNPAGSLIEDLDKGSWSWLSQFRRLGRSDTASQQLASLTRQLEDAIFTVNLSANAPGHSTQALLRLLGNIQQQMAASPKARDNCPTMPPLRRDWFTKANDASPEFQLAAGLAGLHARIPSEEGHEFDRQAFRRHMAPEKDDTWPKWDDDGVRDVTLGHGPLAQGLPRTLLRRLIVAEQEDHPDKPLRGRCSASLAAISAWLADDIDEKRLDELMRGLALVRLPRYDFEGEPETAPLPVAYRLLKPLFTTDEQLHRCKLIEPGTHLPLSREIPRRLMRGDTDGAVVIGMRRLRIAGIGNLPKSVDTSGVKGPRLLAALMTPISDSALKQLLPRQKYLAEQTEETA